MSFPRCWATVVAVGLMNFVAGCALLSLAPGGQAHAAEPPQGANAAKFHAAYLEARLAIEDGLYDQALRRLDECRQARGCPPEVFVAIAEVQQLRNQPDQVMRAIDEGLVEHPESVALLTAKARALGLAGNIQEAIEAYEAALKVEPNRQGLLEELSRAYLQKLRGIANSDDLQPIIRELTSVYERMLPSRRGTQRVPPLLVLSNLYMRLGEQGKALASASEAVNIRPREMRAQVALGDVQEALGNHDDAIACYREAFLIDPGNDEVETKLNAILEAKGGPDAKVAFYRSIAEERPGHQAIQGMYVQQLIDLERWDEAVPTLQSMREHWPDDLRTAMALVRIWLDRGKLDDAVAVARETAGQSGQLVPSVVLPVVEGLVVAGGERLGEAEALLDALSEAALAFSRNDVDLLRALILKQRREFGAALELFKQLIERNPRSSQLAMQAGLLCQELKRHAEAEAYYRLAMDAAPDEAEPYNTLGYFLAETNQKLDEAETLIRKAISMNPSGGHIVDSLGWVLYMKGDYAGAVTQLEKAVEMMANDNAPDAVIFDHLGDAYSKDGKLSEARQAWRKALELNPEEAIQTQIRSKLGEAR